MSSVSINLLYEALGSPLGVVLQCDNVEKVRQRLYKLRADHGDADLECLHLVQSPSNPSHLWIVKKVPADET